MPNVNLIAVRRAEKKRMEAITRQLFLGLAASVGLLILLIIFLGTRHALLLGQLAHAKSELAKIQPELNRIAEMEQRTARLQPKVDTLEAAKAGTERYRNLFLIVSQSMPDSTWLSTLNSQGTSEDTSVTLAGVAGSQALVGDTMTRLQRLPLFDRVDLHQTSSAAATEKDPERINFEVSAHLRPPLPPAGAAPAGGAGTPAPAGTTPAPPKTAQNTTTPGGQNGRG